ncbi:MAG: T9SS type A sorting domain-containing protein [Ignavibacteriae bacterium]|nr:T9SS C-terminal target domain-containing protein [Ignavibacteriota bacterium]NOG97384.1 T9SS type A sorting domain-containing protein [Ignavibacteriota bacterium]
MKKIFAISIFILSLNQIIAQTPHPLDFFPHHEGDIFEYFFPTTAEYFQNIITQDSLGDDGKYYIIMDSPSNTKWSVDTMDFEVRNRKWGGIGPLNNYSNLLFKLNADSGDTWTVVRDSFLTIRADVIDVFSANLFGEDVVIKVIDYSDSVSGLYFCSYWLSSKFGIIREYGDPPWEPVYYMRGAEIDNVTYGTVTSINIYLNKAYPNNFTLNQNYPNPFNPTTTISYALPLESKVTLEIYDITGKLIQKHVSQSEQAGYHNFIWNGKNSNNFDVASGVYIYRFIAASLENKDVFSKSDKMMLVR